VSITDGHLAVSLLEYPTITVLYPSFIITPNAGFINCPSNKHYDLLIQNEVTNFIKRARKRKYNTEKAQYRKKILQEKR